MRVTFPDDVPILTDGTVTLRPHREEDVPALLEQALDPAMVEWTTVPVPSSEETAREYATKVIPSAWERGQSWSFAVETQDDVGAPRFCGTVELRNEGDRRGEIAYGAHPWARGRGVMERACRLLLEWGFATQRLESVIWWAHKGNWASRKLAWRLGFAVVGEVPRWLPHRGVLLDAWVAVLRAGDPRTPVAPWFDVPRIDAGAVTLRELREGDVARIVEACSDEQTAYWLSRMPSPYTREDALAYLEARRERHASGQGLTWAVAEGGTDVLLGCISLFDLDPGRRAEVGYWTHPAARGRGVMTQACRLAVRHAFVPVEDGGLGLERVAILHAEGNIGSQRVIERTGFALVGRERRAARLRDGRLVDNLAYDMVAEEFAV